MGLTLESLHRLRPGGPSPLGATWDGKGVNFALFSETAEKVVLCLFDAGGERETERIELRERTDNVWHGYVPELAPGTLYGYRVYGPYVPTQGNYFNHNKLLVDPYTRALAGRLTLNEACFGYRIGERPQRALATFDERDSAPFVPKSVVVTDSFAWGDDRPPRTDWDNTLLYETHVKGMTALHPGVPQPIRGTFAGLRHPAVIDHIRSLGVTAVELLPVQAFADERHLLVHGLHNYWGYNSYAYFAPEPRYLGEEMLDGFQTMIARYHEAGIEVVLDVVYNHTGEGDALGPTLSFRGIDNLSYYKHRAGDPGHYADVTGCGNSLNVDHPMVRQLILDSLRYWVDVMHIDGFRFDLAPALVREHGVFNPHAPLLTAMRQDPVLSGVKLIAEPWDLGHGGYQLGAFPQGWAEWNDQYRDEVRRYWKGYDPRIAVFASRLSGSSDIFESKGRPPTASINFVTAHDGFALEDLVSYNAKHNRANMEGTRDGNNNTNSDNHGVEGETDLPEIRSARLRRRRNLVATLLLSRGVPMLLSGDEIGRSQGGNNNAYCQDNEISWTQWEKLRDEDRHFHDFVRRLAAIRRQHPVFRRGRFFHGTMVGKSGLRDISWITPQGRRMTENDWSNPSGLCFGFHLVDDGEYAVCDVDGEPAGDRFIVFFNAEFGARDARMPPTGFGRRWRMIFDTSRDEPFDGGPVYMADEVFELNGQSVVLFGLDRGLPGS